jgi:LCP family protein required for cell wall assembly
MADPPRGDKPQYKVYRAGSDAPARDVDSPSGADQQRAPEEGRQPPQQPPSSPPPTGQPQPPRQYNVYRSGGGVRDRLEPSKLDPRRLFKRRQGDDDVPGPLKTKPARSRSRIALKALKYGTIASVVWILLAVVLFFVSAQTQPGVGDDAKNALSPGGTLLTGSTILVLGSDARPKNSKEPGAGGPSRSDSILLLHVGLGTVTRLSIPRDSYTNIPGHGMNKINAAYAFGGPALTIKTIEQFLGNGLEINHLILVDFQHFPEFIDSLGGVDVTLKKCVHSNSFGGKKVNLSKGTHHLTGHQALAFSRVRENFCDPRENDIDRGKRQQQVLSSIKSRAFSVRTFFHAPWVAWNAPRAIRSDLHGPGLSALASDLVTGGSGKTSVLTPAQLQPNLIVDDNEKRDAVRRLLGK